jgi:hypothetical protein
VQPPWFIIGRTARAPYLRGPVSSTLGRVSPCSCVYSPSRHQQPSGAPSQLGKSSLRGIGLRRLLEPDLNLAALRGWRLWHTAARSRCQFHGRSAFEKFGPLRQARAGGAGEASPTVISWRRTAGALWHVRFGSTWAASAHIRQRGLTGRSTGPPTAGRLGRAAPLLHHAPRGQGVLPSSPG